MEDRLLGASLNADSAIELLQRPISEETYAKLEVSINRSRRFLEHALSQEHIVNNSQPHHP